jgi:hypothetical protein
MHQDQNPYKPVWNQRSLKNRDAPDTDLAGYPAIRPTDIWLNQKPDTGYPAGYPVRAGYRISARISGWVLGLTNIFLVKYQINLFKQL